MGMITRTLMNSAGKIELGCFSPSCPFSGLIYPMFHILSTTLCSEEVLTFVNTRMLFWACSTSKPEGFRGNLNQSYTFYSLVNLNVMPQESGLSWLHFVYSLSGPSWEHIPLPGYDHVEGPENDSGRATGGADPAWGSYQPADLHHGGKPDISHVRTTREVRYQRWLSKK